MLKYLKPYTESALQKLLRHAPRINPNIITIAGLLPPIFFMYFLIQGRYGWAILFFFGALLDLIDGAYARMTHQDTKFGAVLDASLDRISDAIIITAFGFAGLVSWWLCVALLTASVTISYIKARGEVYAPRAKALSVGPIERAERLALLALGLILLALFTNREAGHTILYYDFVILIVLSSITVIRRLLAAHKILAGK